MTSKRNEYEPDYRVPPCETLREVMRERALTPYKLASAAGLKVRAVRRLVAGSKAITPIIAKKLERATGVPGRFWFQLQRDYDRKTGDED